MPVSVNAVLTMVEPIGKVGTTGATSGGGAEAGGGAAPGKGRGLGVPPVVAQAAAESATRRMAMRSSAFNAAIVNV